MARHPVNLAVRFLLELAALAAYGYWGFVTQVGVWRFVVGIGLPLLAAFVWGVFRVPGDPRDAPVPVSGALRLLLEAAFFLTAVILLWTLRPALAIALGALVLVHYAVSYDRVRWLLGRGPKP